MLTSGRTVATVQRLMVGRWAMERWDRMRSCVIARKLGDGAQ